MMDTGQTITVMEASTFPLLSILIFSLPVAVALIWIFPPAKARLITLITALIDLSLTLYLLVRFDTTSSSFQFVEDVPWIQSLNVHYTVGVDGLSILFLPLTVLLFIGVILASWKSTRTMPRLFFSLLLLLECTTLGIFVSLNTILFFMFWELSLLPLYFLISHWGIGPNRRFAAVKYTMMMLAGGIPLLFGFILLAFYHAQQMGLALPAGLSFDYLTLLNNPLPAELQAGLFFLLFIGFAFKAPLFPLHTWLPTVAMEGPTTVAAFMTGLKLGLYGIIRFVIPLAPAAAQEYSWLLIGLGVTGMLYGALIALTQKNIRQILAFSSISHVGLVMLGIGTFTLQGFQGALFQLLNFSLVASGIFILTGYIHHRTGSTEMLSLSGLARSMPVLSAFFFLFGMASIGVPGTNGFAAEHLIIFGALTTNTGTGLAALLGVILAAAYFLRIYQKAFMGAAQGTIVSDAIDINQRELVIVVVFAVLILVTGLYPESVLSFIRIASESWIGRI